MIALKEPKKTYKRSLCQDGFLKRPRFLQKQAISYCQNKLCLSFPKSGLEFLQTFQFKSFSQIGQIFDSWTWLYQLDFFSSPYSQVGKGLVIRTQTSPYNEVDLVIRSPYNKTPVYVDSNSSNLDMIFDNYRLDPSLSHFYQM